MAGSGPIRLGLVGLGRAGWGMHCAELKGKTDRFRLVAACDVVPARRQRMEQVYGARTYEEIEGLIADPEVELVDIASRSTDHFRHASMALEAGKTVFLEKPMCSTYEEALRLREVIERTGGRLYVRHNRRFEPGFQHVREILASGVLGSVFEIKLRRVSFQRRDDWQTLRQYSGGQFLNWGPHIVDHGLRLLESPLKTLWSDQKRVAAVGDAEDHIKLILVGENGRMVDLEISGGAAIGEPEYLIWGSRGALWCDDVSIKLRYLDPEAELPDRQADSGTPEAEEFGTSEDLPWIDRSFPVCPAEPVDLTTIWDRLYETVRHDAPFPVTLEQALEVMKVIAVAKGEAVL